MLGLMPIGSGPLAGNGNVLRSGVGTVAAGATLVGVSGTITIATATASGSSAATGVGSTAYIAAGFAHGSSVALGVSLIFPPRRRTFVVPAGDRDFTA